MIRMDMGLPALYYFEVVFLILADYTNPTDAPARPSGDAQDSRHR
jgi:hypothetical protein